MSCRNNGDFPQKIISDDEFQNSSDSSNGFNRNKSLKTTGWIGPCYYNVDESPSGILSIAGGPHSYFYLLKKYSILRCVNSTNSSGNPWAPLGISSKPPGGFSNVVAMVHGEGVPYMNYLYIVSNNSLYKVNLSNGFFTNIGPLNIWPKSCTQAATFYNGYLYIQHYQNSIYKVNVNTGAYRAVGPLGLWPNNSTAGMAICNGKIYILNYNTLEEIDPVTETYQHIGSIGDWPYAISRSICRMGNNKLYIMRYGTALTEIGYQTGWHVCEVDPVNETWNYTGINLGNIDAINLLSGSLVHIKAFLSRWGIG